MRCRLIALVVAIGGGVAQASPGLVSESDPYPGVHHERWNDPAIPAEIHVLEIDLTLAELTVFATAEDERGVRTSSFAQSKQAQIGINGDAFTPSGYQTLGLAAGDGAVWSQTADDDEHAFFRFARVGERTVGGIVPPEDVVAGTDLPDGTAGVVSGRPMLVRAGQPVTGFDCADEVAIPCLRAPRTALGLSDDGNTMWLVVVDGWQAGSLGMTATELAMFLDSLGARDALGFDGGGAATMYVSNEGGVVNDPSDGAERTIANHLAIRHGALTPGQLVGFIRERDVFDASANLAGALVTLDDGRTDTTGTDGLYNFAGVSPRYACVTATLDTYRPETACKQVLSGQVNYNSIALYPWSDFPDAGPGGADAAPPDGPNGPDGGPTGDGGNNAGGDGGPGGSDGPGCGCRAAAGPGSWWLAAIVLVALRRRRSAGDGSVSRRSSTPPSTPAPTATSSNGRFASGS